MKTSVDHVDSSSSSSLNKHSVRSSKKAFLDRRSLVADSSTMGNEDGFDNNDVPSIYLYRKSQDKNIFLLIFFYFLQAISIIGGCLLVVIWVHFGIKYNIYFNWLLLLAFIAINTHLLGTVALFRRSRKIGIVYLLMVIGSVLFYAYITVHISAFEGKFDTIYLDKWDALSSQERSFIESEFDCKGWNKNHSNDIPSLAMTAGTEDPKPSKKPCGCPIFQLLEAIDADRYPLLLIFYLYQVVNFALAVKLIYF